MNNDVDIAGPLAAIQRQIADVEREFTHEVRVVAVAYEGQAADAYKTGQYALGNVLYYPVPNVMVGGEFQWGRRENFADGFQSDGVKVQFSFKYNFSWKLGG